MSAPTLLESVQGLLERTYRMSTGLDPARFVIGERGYLRLYGAPAVEAIGSGDGSGARTLVRQTSCGLRLSLFFPGAMIDRLEAYPPQHGVGEENVDAFAVLVEELDHLLVIAERFGRSQPVSAFELELHANVSKYLVLARFLAGGKGRLRHEARQWLRHQLFGKSRFAEDDPEVLTRYREARRWAVRFLDAVSGLAAPLRLERLRSFHAAGVGGKLELIRSLP